MEIREGKYLLKLAETPAEKNQLYLLRHRVYWKELNFAGKSEYEEETVKDRDAFDEFCDHLLIRDEEQNRCVGTFRFLPGGRLPQGSGFYSEQWFDLGKLSTQRKHILELGRACIDAQYRNTSVFRLLFAGLGAYLKRYPHDYLIGLTTLPADAKDNIGDIAQYLVGNHAVNIAFGIKPKKQFPLSLPESGEFSVAQINHREIIKKMSTLMLAYYKYGAEFISEPSVDVDFNPPVYDFFTLFETHKFPSWV
ncbi:acyl-coa n-acyltransferase [Lucifera butyrica]|uniref:Acyl-coa n-acyltransferase n=2 Tax=Lucifera butyrica TaxID=1351585 RepID=A0A498RFR7_9FIRM|nr:acyl-coa n-acyltransferase [Lucifera butyrica]